MVVNFKSDNFRLIVEDDISENSKNTEFLCDENCCFEIRVKKSFLLRLISEVSSSSGKASVSNIIMTNREIQVLKYLADGLNNIEISEKMNVSVHTIKSHIHNIFEKLAVDGRTQAVVKAIKDNLIDL